MSMFGLTLRSPTTGRLPLTLNSLSSQLHKDLSDSSRMHQNWHVNSSVGGAGMMNIFGAPSTGMATSIALGGHVLMVSDCGAIDREAGTAT
eukprot:1322509-Pyramimonas_sp.AAC.1